MYFKGDVRRFFRHPALSDSGVSPTCITRSTNSEDSSVYANQKCGEHVATYTLRDRGRREHQHALDGGLI